VALIRPPRAAMLDTITTRPAPALSCGHSAVTSAA
jgi:hypothetical protein